MGRRAIAKIGQCLLFSAALSVFLVSCPDTNTPKTYSRIVIDTYKPLGGGFTGLVNFISLFDGSGDPTPDTSPNLWNDDNAPYTVDAPTVSIAEDDNGNPIADFSGYARIDYTGGLTSGIYYIRVRGQTSLDSGAYAIRIVEYVDSTVDKNAQYPPAEGWFFASPNNSDTPYEPDDDPTSGDSGAPTNPVSIGIGDKLNRYLSAGDVDWFKLVLP